MWLIHMCDVTHSYVWYDWFICVIWLIHMFDVTHSHVWHDSFTSVIWHACARHLWLDILPICDTLFYVHAHTPRIRTHLKFTYAHNSRTDPILIWVIIYARAHLEYICTHSPRIYTHLKLTTSQNRFEVGLGPMNAREHLESTHIHTQNIYTPKIDSHLELTPCRSWVLHGPIIHERTPRIYTPLEYMHT